MKMEIEKSGFKLNLDGEDIKVSNKYGMVFEGKAEAPDDEKEKLAERIFAEVIQKHSVQEIGSPTCIKKVVFYEPFGGIIQLQAVLPAGEDCWRVQVYDNELLYVGQYETDCIRSYEVTEWMKRKFRTVKGLTAEVFRSSLGDCTNGGISSARRRLYILAPCAEQLCVPFEPEDIRECVEVIHRNVGHLMYVNCRPLYCKNRWYMAGGNFLYTSDSRFQEITGVPYPISIHDRYEGK